MFTFVKRMYRDEPVRAAAAALYTAGVAAAVAGGYLDATWAGLITAFVAAVVTAVGAQGVRSQVTPIHKGE